MASESRQLPDSNVTRLEALNAALAKNTDLGLSSFLTADTQARLLSITPLYIAAMNEAAFKKQAMASLSHTKDVARRRTRMVISHFIQVFNFAVDRHVYAPADRAYYKLDIETGNVPDLSSDADLITWANNIIAGETERLADGGVAMANPSLADVNSFFNPFIAANMPQNAAVEAYNNALEAIEALNVEADKVIKRVWDEVETHFDDETPESARQDARLWGVIFTKVGNTKKVTGTVTDAETGLPIEGVKVRFKNGRGFQVTDEQGNYEISTTLMNKQLLDATDPLYLDYQVEVMLVEGQNKVVNIQLTKMQ